MVRAIEAKVTSSTNLKSNAYLSADDNENITASFSPTNTGILARGWISTYLSINISNNAAVHPYTLPLSANISFPDKIFNRESTPVSVNTHMTINVQAPLQPLEQYAAVWNTFGPTIKDSYALISAILLATGIPAWLLARIRRRRNREQTLEY